MYKLFFHGPEESKRLIFSGPNLDISFQEYCRSLQEQAAKNCLEKYEGIEILPEDIFDEMCNLLVLNGFDRADLESASFCGTQIGFQDFGENLGKILEKVLNHNKRCIDILENT